MALSKIKTNSIADNAITSTKIGVDVIVAEDLADNSITVAEIASNAVTTAKIADANVTTDKLATTLTVTHALGSASTPSITFTGDTNTGIFSPAADTIAFAEGGTERMRIDSSGNVGIGNTPSGTYKLEVTGAISTSNNLTFTGTGNRITGDFSNATEASRVAFQTSTANSATIITAIPNGTNLNGGFRGYNNADPTNAAWIGISTPSGTSAALISSITGTGTYLPMTFHTGGGEKVRIDTSGNVGIGTSSPGANLDVTGAAHFKSHANLANDNAVLIGTVGKATAPAGGQGTLGIYSNDAGASQLQGTLTLITSATAGERRLAISAIEQSIAHRNVTLAEGGGNVGIGTSSPASRLSSNVSGAGSVTALNLTNDNGGFAAGTGPAINFGVASGGTVGLFGKLEVLNQTATIGSNSYMAFSTRGGDVLAEQMRIDSAGLLKFNSGYGSVATAYGCRAWVNFNGTGTVAIRASGNVSSITDNGTGDYTVNFTTAMPDANYQINTSIGVLSTGSGGVAGVYTSATVPTASLCRVFSVGNSTDTITDTAYFYVSIFR